MLVEVRVLDRGPKVPVELHQGLIAPVTDVEIKVVVLSIANNKSPRLDGFSSGFYKAAWSVISEDLVAVVKEFFESGKLLKTVNAIALVLTPKSEAPRTIKEF